MLKLFSLGSAVVGLSLATLWTPMAEAQEATMQQLRDCAAIENPLQRLVCYDKLVAGDGAYTPARASQVNDKEGAFGREHHVETQDVPNEIHLQLASVHENALGKLEFTFTNGQKWLQIDSVAWPRPKQGSYFIERAALNSFMLGREGENRRMRVRRVE
ncbi:hypothetical protein CWI80_09900 [Pseudidiomarina sediminum]|uniref:Uncharacterized protein n=1 Tax=Pseudidiomarina sediminum TaxID=431675 RepID=A0A432Z2I0_9GAMM|nr:hypothetical protein [Pseudidiomarina sediminum]MBY6064432.1 type VI secretion protein [Pseudidiomarina sediminum]RUO72104.1 hypothetical protein CWI80_09900 [Pseudidiomarina sediminum]